MLDVIFYQSTDDLAIAEVTSAKPLIICPSPLVADGLRRLVPSGLEIITVSKWVSDFLKNKNQKRTNKAELMLRLSSVWRHYFPTEDAQIFFRGFEIFTDLRSFSLNLDLLSEFLRELDPIITKSVLIFWTFLENEQIIDEHKSYAIMGGVQIEQPIWVIGFKHLSGIQIDMLKEIGERTEVRIFFPKDVYEETLGTDWIRWLVPEAAVASSKKKSDLKVIYYPKNKLNVVLNSVQKFLPKFDITLAGRQLDFNFRQEVVSADQFFKSPEDLFEIKREKLFEDLMEVISTQPMELEAFKLMLEEKKQQALKIEDYIQYKLISLTADALILYGEFQNFVDLFSLRVLRIIIELNCPRVAVASLTATSEARLLEINELPYKEDDHPLIVVASSNYGSMKSGESKYSEKMLESLKTIAPVKRSGLDFSYLKSELRQALTDSRNLLLMEEGLEQIDLAWREILKDFNLEIVNSQTEYHLKKKKDHLSFRIKPAPHPVKKFSASRLQAFLDCPRKYYFSYIEKLDHRPEERLKIAADEMGILEHKIIQNYFETKSLGHDFDMEILTKICEHELKSFIEKNRVQLTDKVRLTTFYELLHFSQNGVEYLINFCRTNNASEIKFEHELESNRWNLTGSIDCMVILPENQIALFDFKRSNAAIGSRKETMAFEKIQIWTYLLFMMRHRGVKLHSWGYLNLSEIESSLVSDETVTETLNNEIMDKFESLLLQAMNNVQCEQAFIPAPRHPKICHFCEVQLFCSKGIE